MQKIADEVINSPKFVQYKLESRIMSHYTHPDATRPLIEYIQMSYGVEPEEVKNADFISLDPGGVMFTKEKMPHIEFYIDNVGFKVKPEHVIAISNIISNRKTLTNDHRFSKMYMKYSIAVLPEEMFEKLTNKLYEFGEQAMQATREEEDVMNKMEEGGHLYRSQPKSNIEATEITKDLVKLANSLDAKNYCEEADIVDSVMMRIAGERLEDYKRAPGYWESLTSKERKRLEEQWKRLKNWSTQPPEKASRELGEWLKSFFSSSEKPVTVTPDMLIEDTAKRHGRLPE